MDQLHRIMDRRSLLLAATLNFSLVALAQPITPVLVTTLPPLLHEASAMFRTGNALWVGLDSGNSNTLYRIDQATGEVLQAVVLGNATNVDWEEATTDGTWVYVADIGNNAGHRTGLRFYRFPLLALTATATSVVVDTIAYHYADQTDFTTAYDANNWDCEAFIALDDSLFLFTKNWLDERTHVYALPARPGQHSAQRRDAYDTEGLVTAAAYDPASGDIVLLGHTGSDLEPFIWFLHGHADHRFFAAEHRRFSITGAPLQAEAITYSGAGELLMASEALGASSAAVWRLLVPPTAVPATTDKRSALRAHPVPADRHIQLEGADDLGTCRVFEINGALIAELPIGPEGWIALPDLPAGDLVIEVPVGGRPQRLAIIIAH